MTDQNASFWNREDDKRWRERTDERLASLTSGETVQNDRIDEIEDRTENIDRILRGDPDKDTSGLIEQIHELQTRMNRIYAIMAPDAIGGGGILNRLSALEKREAKEGQQTEYRSKRWIAILGLISAIAVAIIANFDRIQSAFARRSPAQQLAHIERQIEELQKLRGPEVRKKVKELQAQARELQSAPERWK